MPDYSLPTTAHAARLRLTTGEVTPGRIFVLERVPQHSGPETPLEMLNRPDSFFAFQPERGRVMFVAKAHTVEVALDTGDTIADPARRNAARTVVLELLLPDGVVIHGAADFELPEFHSRAIDYLNATREPFFALVADGAIHLVNRSHVLYARPEA